MARIWGVEVRPVNNCLMTTILGAAATTSSCCLFRENEFSTQAGLFSLSSGPHHNEFQQRNYLNVVCRCLSVCP